MDMHGSLDRFDCGLWLKAAEGPFGRRRARVPTFLPSLFGARPCRRGVFFRRQRKRRSDRRSRAGRAD